MAFQSTYYIKNGDWSYEEFSSAIKIYLLRKVLQV